MRLRLSLLTLILASLACQTLFPTPAPLPTATQRPPRPTPTLALDVPTLTPTASLVPTESAQANGVRACAYQPGVSIPAQMPPEVTNGPTPTPYPTLVPPTPSQVDADTTARQLQTYQDLWDTVNENYLYADFNGHDWNAIGQKYKALIQSGLRDDDFYLAMDEMIAELGDEHSF